MTKQTVMEYISMLTALNMRVTGQTINNTAKAKRPGLMAVSTMGNMSIQRRKAKEHTHGLMETGTQETGKTMLSRERASTFGLMEEFTAVSGETT